MPGKRLFLRAFPFLRALVAFGILGLLLTKVQPRMLVTTFRSADLRFLGVVAALAGVNAALQIYRWRLVARLAVPDLGWEGAARSFLAGLALGIVTPGRVGELGRAYFVPDASKSLVAGMTLLDKYFTLSTTVAVGLLSLVALPILGRAVDGLLALLAFFIFAWLVLPQFMRQLARFVPARYRGHEEVRKFAAGVRIVRSADAVRFVGLNLTILILIGLEFCVAVKAFGYVECWSGVAAALVTLAAKVVLPLSVGDVGVREAASALLFRFAGASPARAVSGALTIYFLNVVVPALVGLHWVLGLYDIVRRKKKHAILGSTAPD